MSFRRNWKEKLKLLKRAGLDQTSENVKLLNSVSKKNRGKL